MAKNRRACSFCKKVVAVNKDNRLTVHSMTGSRYFCPGGKTDYLPKEMVFDGPQPALPPAAEPVAAG